MKKIFLTIFILLLNNLIACDFANDKNIIEIKNITLNDKNTTIHIVVKKNNNSKIVEIYENCNQITQFKKFFLEDPIFQKNFEELAIKHNLINNFISDKKNNTNIQELKAFIDNNATKFTINNNSKGKFIIILDLECNFCDEYLKSLKEINILNEIDADIYILALNEKSAKRKIEYFQNKNINTNANEILDKINELKNIKLKNDYNINSINKIIEEDKNLIKFLNIKEVPFIQYIEKK